MIGMRIAGGNKLQIFVQKRNAADAKFVHARFKIVVGCKRRIAFNMAADLKQTVGQAEKTLGAVRRDKLIEADALLAQGLHGALHQRLRCMELKTPGKQRDRQKQRSTEQNNPMRF